MYAPGIFCSEVHLAKYCLKAKASTGELISCTQGIETIGPNAVSCNFAEIKLKSTESVWTRMTTKPVRAITGWFNRYYGIQVGASGAEEAGLSALNHSFDLFKVNIGQIQDLQIYREALQKYLAKQLDSTATKVILYGTSRGSATVFNYFAHYDSPEVAAVVCEGVFDSVPNIVQQSSWFMRAKFALQKLISVTDFKVDGISPLASVDLIKVDKPIALITSEADRVVPMACTKNLYKKLRAKGFAKVHLLCLKTSSHNVYPLGSEKEQYRAFIHAFYQKYNLPHIPEYAAQGQELLKQSQPDFN